MALRYGSSRGGSSCFSRVFKEFQMKITYYFRFSFFFYIKVRKIKKLFQQKKLLIVRQILHVSILGNVKRTVWRISILILGSRGLGKLLIKH